MYRVASDFDFHGWVVLSLLLVMLEETLLFYYGLLLLDQSLDFLN